ncbi:MAG: S8 family serine peptidase [Sphingomicrobium sp.]
MRRTFASDYFARAPFLQGNSFGAGPELFYLPSDSMVASQWHLKNSGQTGGTAGIDINVTTVWDDYTGAGVLVAVYDDGVDYTHPDLNDNYDASQQLVIGGTTYSAMPTTGYHGTAVAGLIAAENDGSGTVGVAYGADITGVPILRSSNAPDLLASLWEMDRFDIVNNSWGYTTPFQVNASSSDSFWQSFEGALANAGTGRGGLGTIIVKSAGNNRSSGLDTNYDNFTNHRMVIAVGAVDHNGAVSYYSTPGANLLVVAPSSTYGMGLTTTDIAGAAGSNSGDYVSNFGGTSAAAPQVSGVVALMLEANPDLGWRDVQEILALSARQVGDPTALTGSEKYAWSYNGAGNWNGGGMHFSNDYGFGLVDALAAVRLAESWGLSGTSANEIKVGASATMNTAIPDNGSVVFQLSIPQNILIDHVELTVDILHSNLGDLRITLTSPDGTISIVMDRPLNGTDSSDNLLFRFGSNAFWGESSAGNWTVTITDANGGNVGSVQSISLAAYGDTATANDVYVFTNEYASLASDPARSTLTDSDGGIDTLNCAAVTSGSTLDLHSGASCIIAGKSLTIANGTLIEAAWGGDGADVIFGNSSANKLYGARGDDTLEGGAADDLIDGGAGNDIARFTGDRSRYTITAENGGYRVTDSRSGGDGSDFLLGVETLKFADGLYSLTGGSTPPPPPPPPPPLSDINGTAGNDTLDGSSGDDRIFGNDGNDRLRGKAGADRLDGGNGVDVADYAASAAGVSVNLATGQAQNGDAAGDTLVSVENIDGSALADTLTGDASANRLSGGAGNDLLDGGAGADALLGGTGDDTYYVDSTSDVITENVAEGTDTLVSSVSLTLVANVENLVLGGSAAINGTGNSLANTLVGNGAANILDGASGDDFLQGFAGNDTLYGQAGNDRLEGGDGADLLIGGAGRDTLVGGIGRDRFDLDLAGDSAVGSGDQILDFGAGSDWIDLSTMDAKIGTKKNDAFQFIGDAAFTGAAGQLRYEIVDLAGTAGDYTRISGDLNGDKVADFEIILIGHTDALHSTDFIL